MATKKAPKKTAVKAAKPVKKAPSKPSKSSGGKPVAKKAAAKKPVAKAAPKKAIAKKAAPAPKKAAAKPAKPAPKPVKKAAPAPAAVAKKAAPVPPVKKSIPAKSMPVAPVKTAQPAVKAALPTLKSAVPPVKAAEPVKKPAISAPSTQEVKPDIRPLERPVKKDPPKPIKVVIPKTSTTKAVKYEPDFMRSVLDTHQHENTGPTMRYPDSELTEFKDLILKKLDTAKKELAYLQGLITRKDEGDMEDGRYMTMEDGSMSMEREQLSQMASRQIQFIDHLEKALMRIENKTYGICRVTGKLIDKARLRAVPHATLSIEAKQMMNK
jgi:RNA polymerase-binding transcription factor DksA